MDLKGWWAVSDDEEATVARECVGTMPWGDKLLAAMLRNPATGECDLATFITAYSWFQDRETAEVHAAKIVADYNAANVGEGTGLTGEAA